MKKLIILICGLLFVDVFPVNAQLKTVSVNPIAVSSSATVISDYQGSSPRNLFRRLYSKRVPRILMLGDVGIHRDVLDSYLRTYFEPAGFINAWTGTPFGNLFYNSFNGSVTESAADSHHWSAHYHMANTGTNTLVSGGATGVATPDTFILWYFDTGTNGTSITVQTNYLGGTYATMATIDTSGTYGAKMYKTNFTKPTMGTVGVKFISTGANIVVSYGLYDSAVGGYVLTDMFSGGKEVPQVLAECDQTMLKLIWNEFDVVLLEGMDLSTSYITNGTSYMDTVWASRNAYATNTDFVLMGVSTLNGAAGYQQMVDIREAKYRWAVANAASYWDGMWQNYGPTNFYTTGLGEVVSNTISGNAYTNYFSDESHLNPIGRAYMASGLTDFLKLDAATMSTMGYTPLTMGVTSFNDSSDSLPLTNLVTKTAWTKKVTTGQFYEITYDISCIAGNTTVGRRGRWHFPTIGNNDFTIMKAYDGWGTPTYYRYRINAVSPIDISSQESTSLWKVKWYFKPGDNGVILFEMGKYTTDAQYSTLEYGSSMTIKLLPFRQ